MTKIVTLAAKIALNTAHRPKPTTRRTNLTARRVVATVRRKQAVSLLTGGSIRKRLFTVRRILKLISKLGTNFSYASAVPTIANGRIFPTDGLIDGMN